METPAWMHLDESVEVIFQQTPSKTKDAALPTQDHQPTEEEIDRAIGEVLSKLDHGEISNRLQQDELEIPLELTFPDVIIDPEVIAFFQLIKEYQPTKGRTIILQARKLLSSVNPSSKDGEGNSLLFAAVEKKFHFLVSLLIQHGADVNDQNALGETALFPAAGINVNTTNISGQTALFFVHSGKAAYALNIKNKLETTVVDKNGNTALHVVLSDYNRALTALAIIDLSTNLHQEDATGNSYLHIAVKFSNFSVVKKLLEKGLQAAINNKNQKGRTPLMEALFNNAKIVRLLLSQGADLSMLDGEGNNILHILAKTRSTSTSSRSSSKSALYMLLSPRMVNPHIRNNRMFTPIMVAVIEDDVDLVKKILKKEPQLIRQTSCGRTLLHLAAQYSCVRTLKMLYHLKIFDINEQDCLQDTPLHLATGALAYGSTQSMRALQVLLLQHPRRDLCNLAGLSINQIIESNLTLAERFKEAEKDNMTIHHNIFLI